MSQTTFPPVPEPCSVHGGTECLGFITAAGWCCQGEQPRGWTYDRSDMLESWRSLVGATRWWPNTFLTVEQPFEGTPYVLRVVMRTKDSRNPTGPDVRIDAVKALSHPDHPLDAEAMERMLRGRLREVACHEADEWLLIGSRRPYDPHKRQ